ncbi:MAG: hypothetical protein AABX77_02935 [Nanoarchaeota archaeon]
MITLVAFLRKKPDFNGFLEEDVKIKLVSNNNSDKTYEWFPINRKKPSVSISASDKKSYYSAYSNFTFSSINKDIPQWLINKISKTKGFLIADEEMYRIFQKYPRLENLLKVEEPLWEVLKFTKGKPTYFVSLETKLYPEKGVLNGMCNLAKYFSAVYDGLVWNEETKKFEADGNKLYDFYCKAYELAISKKI